MVNIPIGKNYRIISDANQYILQKLTIGESGKSKGVEKWVAISYHGKIEWALQKYKDFRLMESDATSIQMLLHELDKVNEEISKVMKGV